MVKKIELRIRGTPSQVIDFIDDYFHKSGLEIFREVTKAKPPTFKVGPPKGEPTGRARLLESPGDHTYLVFQCNKEHWETVQPFWSEIVGTLQRAGFIPTRFVLTHSIWDAVQIMQRNNIVITPPQLVKQLTEMEVVNPRTGEPFTRQHIHSVLTEMRKSIGSGK